MLVFIWLVSCRCNMVSMASRRAGDAHWDFKSEEFSRNHLEKLPSELFSAGWRLPWPLGRDGWKIWPQQQKTRVVSITTGQRAGNLWSSLLALSGLYSIGAATTPHRNTNWDGWLWKKKSNLFAFLCHVALPLTTFFCWSASPVSKGFCVLSLRWMPEIKPTERKTASIRGQNVHPQQHLSSVLCVCVSCPAKKKRNYHSAFNGVFVSNLCWVKNKTVCLHIVQKRDSIIMMMIILIIIIKINFCLSTK